MTIVLAFLISYSKNSMAKTFRNFSDYHQTRKALLFRDTKTQNMRNLDLFVTFCQETSLHGWAYLVNDDKSSWLTRYILSTYLCKKDQIDFYCMKVGLISILRSWSVLNCSLHENPNANP